MGNLFEIDICLYFTVRFNYMEELRLLQHAKIQIFISFSKKNELM